MWTVSKSFHISASHCLVGHAKCGRMHGHNYKITVTLGAESLAEGGMVMDFGHLKATAGRVLDQYDHMHLGTTPVGWQANPEHVISLPFTTTAENLAKHWAEEIQEAVRSVRVVSVTVQETADSVATWTAPEGQ